GDIVKLVGNHITPIVRTGKPCKSLYQEESCGRPLGIKFDQNGNLYAADAYYGILKINVKTGEKQVIVDSNQEIAGRKPMLFNSIALATNGDIYWTDSSTDFHLKDGVFTILADPSGRLIHYEAKSKTNRVLIDNLHFANGVMLSEDESFIIVAETFGSRIHRYYLTGAKKGTRDIFIDGLPGMLDNINSDGKGGFLIPLVISADAEHPNLGQIIQPFPLLKKLLARLMGITQLLFETVNRIYPSEFAERSIYYVGNFQMFPRSLDPSRTTLIRLSNQGEIIESLSTTNRNIHSISEAHIFREHLYLGSPFNNHILRIPLSEIGWSDLAQKREKRDVPEIPQTTPPQRQQATTPPPKQQPTTQPPKTTQQTQPPKPQTTLPPPKQQATTPPPKQTPPPQKQQPTTPPPRQQAPAPQKQQVTTPPPSQQTTPPPKQQTTPPPKQETTPPPKQQTTPSPKQQTTPPPKQQTTSLPKQQTNPPPTQHTTPPKLQSTPPPQQKLTPLPQQQATPPPKETPPPARQTTPPQQATPTAKQVPPTAKQATPASQEQNKEQVKAVPVRDAPRAKNS
ncbi:unnamed protein product, partial [Phaedon cochleariae]